MAGVDTSIYNNIAQPNVFGQMKDMIGVSSAVTQNKLLQMQLLGKQVGGTVLQQALDPVTGQVDYPKLLKLLQDNPGGFAAAPEILPTATTIKGGQIANTQSNQNLANSSVSNAGAILGAVVAGKSGPVSRDDVQDAILRGIATGRIQPNVGKAMLQGIPADDKDVRAWAAGAWVQSLPPELQTAAAPGSPTAGGAPTQQTGAQFVAQSVGGVKPATVPPPGGGPGAAGGAPSAVSTPAGGAAAPGVVVGQSPATVAAQGPIGANSATQFNSLINLGDSYPLRVAALGNMTADLEKAFSGPLTADLQKAIAGFNQAFGTNFAAENVAATERFNKLANQIASQQAAMLNTTDQNTMIAMGANPNSNLSKLGNQYVIAMLKGNEDAIRIKAAAANKYLNAEGGDPAKFGAWSTEFNKGFDPRVFQSVYMDDAQKTEMLAGMKTEAEKKAFRDKYNQAVERGWIPDPRGGK